MNRLAKILHKSDAYIITTRDKAANVDRIMDRIDSDRPEMLAYHPFNPENPIYKARGIVPVLDGIKVWPNFLTACGWLNGDGRRYLNIDVAFSIEDDERLEIHLRNVDNDFVEHENKNKHIAAYFINTLQNFVAYSENPGGLFVSAGIQGRSFWSRWFDFSHSGAENYPNKEYREAFAAAVAEKHAELSYDGVLNAVAGLRYPVQFRQVHKILGHDNDKIGRAGMQGGKCWRGECGLEEMSEEHPIRQMGTAMLEESGVQFEHPADFQRVIKEKLKDEMSAQL